MGVELGVWISLLVFAWMVVAPVAIIAVSERTEGVPTLAWCVLALFFSWLGLLVWALVTQKNAGRVACLFCGEKVLPEAAVCPHCRQPGPVVHLPPEAHKLSPARRRLMRRQLEQEARARVAAPR